MSRSLPRNVIALSLFATLSTSLVPLASADRIAPRFAQPPSHGEPAEPAASRIGNPTDATHMDAMPVDRAVVRTALAANRAKNLAAFRIYQRNGVFPSNTYQANPLNVWRDREGHLCAAATIIKMSGQVELVTRVAEQNNFIKLAEVQQGPVMDWILTSGFTQEEIVAIQKPFRLVARPQQPKVEPDLRAAETKRLAKQYRDVEQMIVKGQNTSLDHAVERLMKHPDLAASLDSVPAS